MNFWIISLAIFTSFASTLHARSLSDFRSRGGEIYGAGGRDRRRAASWTRKAPTANFHLIHVRISDRRPSAVRSIIPKNKSPERLGETCTREYIKDCARARRFVGRSEKGRKVSSARAPNQMHFNFRLGDSFFLSFQTQPLHPPMDVQLHHSCCTFPFSTLSLRLRESNYFLREL